MLLQLDPLVPLVWRTTSTLQFGIDRPRLVLEELGPFDELLISALRSGTPRSALFALARRERVDASRVHDLLALLDGVLLPLSGRPQPAQRTVVVDGEGPTAERLNTELAEAGIATAWGLPAPARPDLVVLIAHYALPPRRYGRWLRADVPHLPIVFGDSGVRIGPLVQPGAGPCLFCIDLSRTDEDPAWPTLASQLQGRTAPGEQSHSARLAAALTTGLVTAWLTARSGGGGQAAGDRWATTSVHIGADGWVSRAEHRPHAECGCRALAEQRVPTESETQHAARAGRRPSPPSSAPVVVAPG